MPAHLRAAARQLWRVRHQEGIDAFRRTCQALDPAFLLELTRCWELYARDSQLRPVDCKPIWTRVCGRGEGKTRSASENQLNYGEDWGPVLQGVLCSKTYSDVRDVMIEGESGMMACAERRGYKLRFDRSRGKLTHPSGACWYVATAEKKDGSRGYQSNSMWLDEIAAWPDKTAIDTLDNLMFTWRLPTPEGALPIIDITTTPKPCPVMFKIMKDEELRSQTTVVRGRTTDNAANLNPIAYRALLNLYEGTRKGRQELDGELLDILGPMIDQDTVHSFRVKRPPELDRIIVALDPCVTATDESDAAGIIVVGQRGDDAYVLEDATLETATFADWSRTTVEMFDAWQADAVVAEINQGGTGIVEQIQTMAETIGAERGREIVVPVKPVWAKASKKARAEPIGALYERGRIHHVGHFKALEKEITGWIPGMPSPDRMDALVHGVWHLLLSDSPVAGPLSRY
jgi:phage terminase large subunit-like protein